MTVFDSIAIHKVAIPENEVKIEAFDSIQKVPVDWDRLVEGKDCFLTRKFLRMMEDHPAKGIYPYYLLFSMAEEVVGVAYLQHLHFNFREAFQEVNEEGTWKARWENLSRRVFVWAGNRMKAHPLICGSVFLTGEHGFCFRDGSRLDETRQYEIVNTGMEKLRQAISSRPKIHVVKDLDPKRPKSKGFYESHGYVEFPWLQPSMEMTLPDSWSSFDHYLAAMLSKYRTRARRAAKKAKALSKREICDEELQRVSPRLDELYQGVAKGVGFNVAMLPKDYFLLLKTTFPERFRITGYFRDDQLLGFCTTFRNEREMEAHFLGFDHDANRTHQLYLNMLYDIVRTGIESDSNRIHFGRTAHEIKSSVGAVPIVYHTYVRHTNRLLNNLAGRVLKNSRKEMDWVQRHPFK